jgi:hypothetical protein
MVSSFSTPWDNRQRCNKIAGFYYSYGFSGLLKPFSFKNILTEVNKYDLIYIDIN